MASCWPTMTLPSSFRICATVEETYSSMFIFGVRRFIAAFQRVKQNPSGKLPHLGKPRQVGALQRVKCFPLPGVYRANASADRGPVQLLAGASPDRSTAASLSLSRL